MSRDEHKQNWGRVLNFKDTDGNEHSWSMPMKMLAGEAKELREELLSKGLIIGTHSKAKGLLNKFIQESIVDQRFVSVSQVGWHDKVYVLPDEIAGESEGETLWSTTPSFNSTS